MASIVFNMRAGTLVVTDGGGSFSIAASSGRAPYTNRASAVRRRNEGPIPLGTYRINASELSDPGVLGDMARGLTGDWGDWRVRLHPTGSTRTFGRDGFFLHGGSSRGSAGCIDFGG
ncbi:MAG: DUF2778 domain-containing protein, partial [Deltaproteobacteria bacterium]|nr:DUF2778 domain-containing protein [Deltaproteobacteria bacterium]